MAESIFIESEFDVRKVKPKRKENKVVEKVKKASRVTVRRIENAYAVLAMGCTAAAAVKVATLPKVQSLFGELPIWQVVAGVLLGGLAYAVFQLIDEE